jgi:hypothetical protein
LTLLKTSRLLTTVKGAAVVFFGALVFSGIEAAQDCGSGKGIISNYIGGLATSNDTVWMVSYEQDRCALNYLEGANNIQARLLDDQNWNNVNFGCKQLYNINISTGGGRAVACLVNPSFTNANTVWTFDFTSGKSSEFKFPFPDSLLSKGTTEDSVKLSALGSVYANKCWYFACLDGGLVKWDPLSKSQNVYIPGQPGISVSSLKIEKNKDGSPADTSKRVYDVNAAESLLVVTTPSKIWLLNASGPVWDSTIESSLSNSADTIRHFESAFINGFGKNHPLYCIAAVHKKEWKQSDSISSMFLKYNRADNRWSILLENAPNAISFANNGYMYMISDKNEIRMYRDTLGDSAVPGLLKISIDQPEFQERMIRKTGVDYPDYLNDVRYVPRTDSSGYLWISTSNGLFFYGNEIPGKSTGDFTLVKRAPKVKEGLMQTYARPGLLNAADISGNDTKCVFVYNLSKDAQVTIRVYDFNMDLVKTIINGEFRKAGNNGGPMGRSTVEGRDFWDGKNSSGRTAAPGVYYYKITTNNGERAFGKIVVAK